MAAGPDELNQLKTEEFKMQLRVISQDLHVTQSAMCQIHVWLVIKNGHRVFAHDFQCGVNHQRHIGHMRGA